MNGIYRNLRFWGRNYECMLGWIIAALACIPVISCLLVGNPGEILAAMSDIGNSSLYIPMFLILIGMNGATTYFPFSVSMGSSRRDSFIGMVIMIHVIGLELLLLMAALGSLSGSSLEELVPTVAVCLFLGLFLNNLLCAITFRFGRNAAFSVYMLTILTVIIGVLVYHMVNATVGITGFPKILEVGKMLPLRAWIVIGIAAAILLDAFSILLQWISVRKIEVRV